MSKLHMTFVKEIVTGVFLLFLINPLVAQNSSLVGVNVGDTFVYEMNIISYNPAGYFLGLENGTYFSIRRGSFQIEVNLTSIIGENEYCNSVITYNNRSYERNITPNLGQMAYAYVLYTDWDYYISDLIERHNKTISEGYKTGYGLYYKLTSSEFIIKEVWQTNSFPISTGEAAQNMYMEVRYDALTGIQNFYEEYSFFDSDFGTFSNNIVIKKLGYDFVYIDTKDMVEITTEEDSTMNSDVTPPISTKTLEGVSIYTIFSGLFILKIMIPVMREKIKDIEFENTGSSPLS